MVWQANLGSVMAEGDEECMGKCRLSTPKAEPRESCPTPYYPTPMGILGAKTMGTVPLVVVLPASVKEKMERWSL